MTLSVMSGPEWAYEVIKKAAEEGCFPSYEEKNKGSAGKGCRQLYHHPDGKHHCAVGVFDFHRVIGPYEEDTPVEEVIDKHPELLPPGVTMYQMERIQLYHDNLAMDAYLNGENFDVELGIQRMLKDIREVLKLDEDGKLLP